MTDLHDATTDELIKELGLRYNEFLLIGVEGDVPRFTSMGSPFLLAGLIHAYELLNNVHLIRAIKDSNESKLRLATGPLPPPGVQP